MNKTIAAALALTTAMISTAFGGSFFSHTANAEVISTALTELEPATEYSYDLNGDGKNETLSYDMDEKGTYTITVDGKELLSLELGEWYYGGRLQIADIDKNDGMLDLWAYTYCNSDDIGSCALYRYDGSALNCVYEPVYTEGLICGAGPLYDTDGEGGFRVMVDRALYVDELIGNHWDLVSYEMKDGKVSECSDGLYEIAQILTPEGITAGRLTQKADSEYMTEPASDETFTVREGSLVKPVTITDLDGTYYVGFETEGGKLGYLNAVSYDAYENPAFTDICLAD